MKVIKILLRKKKIQKVWYDQERYRNLSVEEKNLKERYGREKYKYLPEDEK